MRMKPWYVAAAFVIACIELYCTVRILAPELQAASDRICVPLYDETGYECCKRD